MVYCLAMDERACKIFIKKIVIMEMSDLQFAVHQQNIINGLENGLKDIKNLLNNPNGKFLLSGNEDVDFIMEEIYKLQKK